MHAIIRLVTAAIPASEHSRNVAEFFGRNSLAFRQGYERSRDFRARFDIWTGLIDKYAAMDGVRVCLDLGCGPGLFAFHAALRGLRVKAIDLSAEMIAMCRAEQDRSGALNVEFKVGSLPLDSSSDLPEADLILSSSVLEYVPDLNQTIQSISDRLRSGGYFIASFPNRESLFRRYESLRDKLGMGSATRGFIRNTLSIREAELLFESFGFKMIERQFYGDEPLLSRAASIIAPNRFSKNLFVMVLQKTI